MFCKQSRDFELFVGFPINRLMLGLLEVSVVGGAESLLTSLFKLKSKVTSGCDWMV